MGVDLLVGRRSLVAGTVVGVLTIGLIILLMAIGPSLGWTGDTDLHTDTFGTSVESATSARVSIDTGRYSTSIRALPVSDVPDRSLVNADVTYRGVVEFQTSGDTAKTVSIFAKGQHWWWHFLDLADAEPWDIGLDPGTPMDLSVRSSSGSCDVALAGVQLTGLEVDMSAGEVQASLPAFSDRGYSTSLNISSGDLEVEVPSGARVDMTLDMSSGEAQVSLGADSDVSLVFQGSSGQFTLDLAAGQACRVEVRSVSSGDVDLPSGLVQVEEGDGEEGIWESAGYAGATHQVMVIVDSMSSGKVEIHQGD